MFNAFRKPIEGEEDGPDGEVDIEIADNIDKWIGGNADKLMTTRYTVES